MSNLVNKIQDKLAGDSTSKGQQSTNSGTGQNYNNTTSGGHHHGAGGYDDSYNSQGGAYGDSNYGSSNYGGGRSGAGGYDNSGLGGGNEYGSSDKDDWNRSAAANQYSGSQYGSQAANEDFRQGQVQQGTYGTTQGQGTGRTTRSQARRTGELDDPMYDSVNQKSSKW